MKTRTISAELELPLPIEEIFAFFSDARNLERITPPELRFKILNEEPIELREGCLIDYGLGLFGLRFKWRTLISSWNPPHSFVDEQLRGPYALWHHEHHMEAGDGKTVIRDTVQYALPLYPLSELALPLVRKQLRRIFTFRQKAVIEAFGQDPDHTPWKVTV